MANPRPDAKRRSCIVLQVSQRPATRANLKLVEQLIARRPDIRLLTAANGTLGIEVARASQLEVILMDIIPVVALSANAMPRDIEMGMKTGFFLYLTKPIKVNEFMYALRLALEFADQRARLRK